MPAKRITISLETREIGRVPLESFQAALEDLSTILHEVELELSEHRRTKLSWDIAQLGLGSATIGLEPTSKEDSDLADRTSQTVVRGLKQLSREQTRPELFNDTALERARHLAKISGDGVSRINLFSDLPGQQLYVTETIAINAQAILEHLEFVGSVEGGLELISGREGEALYFRVKDVVSGAGVRCFFPEQMLEQALAWFRKRVLVSGVIQCDSSGKPRRIHVDNMELVPLMESLPQPDDVKGIMKDQTGGLPSERYLKEQFGGR